MGCTCERDPSAIQNSASPSGHESCSGGSTSIRDALHKPPSTCRRRTGIAAYSRSPAFSRGKSPSQCRPAMNSNAACAMLGCGQWHLRGCLWRTGDVFEFAASGDTDNFPKLRDGFRDRLPPFAQGSLARSSRHTVAHAVFSLHDHHLQCRTRICLNSSPGAVTSTVYRAKPPPHVL
ncbi:hypothetical protein PYCCODRAFT_920709 [Trametes coccinea BRFM310]|uniref:Uncharacterized protein n=1 Tax=Trametes coccinea (strain BRFM310) TaxID=1353009 RepID=A0A1Y2J084_TRAC3|nr:hypothetical protein PYCCODRAFT_920709 [Trametes coccinea BRFM310]